MSTKRVTANISGCAILMVAVASAGHAASSSDIQQAKQFLSQLPSACGNSSMSTTSDGAVVIRISCEGNSKSMEGIIKIKDGVVTQIR